MGSNKKIEKKKRNGEGGQETGGVQQEERTTRESGRGGSFFHRVDKTMEDEEKKKGIGSDQFRRLGAIQSSGALGKKREKKENSTRDGWASCQPHVVWPLRHMTRCGPSFISQELQTELPPPP
jgi:hypothetical protein